MGKQLSFWKTFAYVFLIILILLTIFFGFIGSYGVSGFNEVFIGIAMFSAILALLATFFIKWCKEYKLKGKFVLEEKNKKQSNFFTDLFKWSMDEKQLKYQIENYDTLGFFKSARKVAAAVMIFFAILNLIFMAVGWVPFGVWIDTILILILALFLYNGNKWAMITAMIYWTFSKGLQFVSAFYAYIEDPDIKNIIMPFIFWAIVMAAFWQAYQVERERTKLNKS